MPVLPARPSAQHLRKKAKRLARDRSLVLADAQRQLAASYAFHSWAEMLRYVARVRPDDGDLATGTDDSGDPSLIAAVRGGDFDAVRRLLAEGANARIGDRRETPLHAAARRGPLVLVELLIASGALEWQRDAAGRTPLDVARRGRPRERAAIVALLDRAAVGDASFRAAIDAVHRGDLATLERLLDAEPRLLVERIVGPEVYRRRGRFDYFRDPKLLWFVANNPTLVERMPENIEAIARAMIARGVEQADLDYTLELVMTSSVAREQGHQRPLMRVLLDAGAVATPRAVLMAAAHREVESLRQLGYVGTGEALVIAAALDDTAALAKLLPAANAADIQAALGVAVINVHADAARMALDAGADVNAFLPVQAHSTALHQAVLGEDLALLRLLIERGADLEARDTLWDGTPLEWAIREKKPAAQALLEGEMQEHVS